LPDTSSGPEPGLDAVPIAGAPLPTEGSAEVVAPEADAAGEDGAVTGDEDGSGTGPDRPVPLRWDPTTVHPEIPVRDQYALRLVATRTLYDRGVGVAKSPSLAPLAPQTTAMHIHPLDLEHLGLATGARIRVSSPRTSLLLTAEADLGVPRGSAAMFWNIADGAVADLIDAAAAVTDVRVETT
jgi:anaerobic selenocysteine-containing dehydrogenase